MKNKHTSRLLIVIDDLSKWNPFFPTDQVISAKEYLFSDKFRESKNTNVINLCIDSEYLSLGHYCSMLAEARGHKIIPSLKTMNDLQKSSFYLGDLEFLQSKVNKILTEEVKENEKTIKVFSVFGKSFEKKFEPIVKAIFKVFPVPLLELEFNYTSNTWRVESLKILSLTHLPKNLEDFFANTIDQFSNRLWRTPASRKKFVCDLGILLSKEEALPPSDEKALVKLEKACKKLNVFCERIYEDDFPRINEFDALFVRTTTSIKNFTYNFIKNAEMEGLIVIDDSDSILRCTNKIFVNNRLEKKGILTIPGRYVLKGQNEELELAIKEYGYPIICKIPDGSFSIGVKKANSKEELIEILEKMFQHSSLVLVQKFMETEYDWRIGVLDNEPIFACKYYMSKGHWQIYNHEKGINTKTFSGKSETLPIYEVPKSVLELALEATSVIGNSLYGVDIKEDINGKVYIVEINDNPNIDCGIEDKVAKNSLYEKIIHSILKRVEENRNISK